MKIKVKPLPAIMTVLSALYFIYVLSSEDTILMADAVGGDPGGKVLPLIMAVFLFLGFLYLTFKERPEGERMDPEIRGLFFITLGLSVLYVLALRVVGFIILSMLLVYILEYVYTTVGEKRDLRQLALGALGSTAAGVVLFVLMRMLSRNVTALGRAGTLPAVFASPTAAACVCLVYVILVTVLAYKTLYRRLVGAGLKRPAQAGLLAVAVVLFLYVAFKQFFSVNLAPGILDI